MKTSELKELLRNNVVDVQDLVVMLDLSIEDIIERFPDQIKDREEFIVTTYGEPDV